MTTPHSLELYRQHLHERPVMWNHASTLSLLIWTILSVPAFGQFYSDTEPPARKSNDEFARFGVDDAAPPPVTANLNQLLPDASSFTVLTPASEPAELALLEAYRGQLINVVFGKDGEPTISVIQTGSVIHADDDGSMPGRLSMRANGEGKFEAVIASAGTKLIVVHDTGYAIHPVANNSDRPDERVIKLQPWGLVSGRVTFNGSPMSTGRVIARWESFPFSPSMMMVPAEQRMTGPPLVSITQTVDVQADGHYQFTKLPPGRVLMSATSSTTENHEATAAAGMPGNVHWWQSVQAAERINKPHDPFNPSGDEFDFSTITVKGSVRMTDQLFERRVVISNTPQGVEVGAGRIETELSTSLTAAARLDS